MGAMFSCAECAYAQKVIAGADVSSLRQMESRGVVFKDAGVAELGLQILRNHGYTWVRLRIMVSQLGFNDPAC
jgi:arabinogalactan endo-1,4-beta-galactosidase